MHRALTLIAIVPAAPLTFVGNLEATPTPAPARELRSCSHATEDNDGVHLVGYTNLAGHDWFLIKESARSSRWGKFEGYYFYRDDYVRLKMLTFTAHEDAIRDLLAKFPAKPQS